MIYGLGESRRTRIREHSPRTKLRQIAERFYALDYLCDFASALATGTDWPRCRGFYPSASRDCSDCFGYQVSTGPNAVALVRLDDQRFGNGPRCDGLPATDIKAILSLRSPFLGVTLSSQTKWLVKSR